MSRSRRVVVIVVACLTVTAAVVAYGAGTAESPVPEMLRAKQSEVVDSQEEVRAEAAEVRAAGLPSERMLALVFFRTEQASGRTQPEIFPLAVYSEGVFTEAAVYPEEELGRQTPLRRFKDFGIYKNGRRVGELTVTDIVAREYGAVQALVGVGHWELPPDYFRPSNVFLAFGVEPDGYTLLEPLLACSPPVPSAELRLPLTAEAARRAKTALERQAAAELGPIARKAGKTGELRIDRLDFRSLDIERDGIPEVIGSFSAPVKSYRVKDARYEDVAYYLAIGRSGQSGLQVLYTETQVEEPQIIGWGPRLLDAVDVDDNRVAEIVLHYRESGWVGFSVLGFREGKLRVLLAGGGMGH